MNPPPLICIYIYGEHGKHMAEIWTEIAKDAESGAKRLVAEYGDRLFATAALLCRSDDDAEDLVFRTFDRAVRKVRQFEPTGDFFNWLYTIMLNFRRMDLRRKRIPLVPVGGTADLPETAGGDFDGAAVEDAGSDEVWRAMKALPPALRETVALKYFEEKRVEEIAALVGVPAGTVKSRLHKARSILHGELSRKRGNKEGGKR